ncbi:MAG TPA: hypothetical protein VF517_06145 [Thermoleophilaceae bacterium]
MRRKLPIGGSLAAVAAIASALASAPAASGSEYSESLARNVEREIVYVDPKATPRVSTTEAGAIRLQITRKDIGRIKVAVVPERRAEREGGASGLAAAVARDLELRGTLLVVAGSSIHAITSHPASDSTVAAVREAFERHEGDRGDQIRAAVDGIAAVDPGPSADAGGSTGGGSSGGLPGGDGDDFFDEINDAVKFTTFIVGIAIALPFIAVFLWILLRFRRARKEQDEDWDFAQEQLRAELIELGDEIRALDVDTSMPGANALGLADYEAAIAQYDRANLALDRAEETPRLRVAEARAALKEGKRRMSDAKVRLGVTPIP